MRVIRELNEPEVSDLPTTVDAESPVERPEEARPDIGHPGSARRVYLAAEFVVLFGGGPMLYFLKAVPLHPFAGLYFFTLLCAALLIFDRTFDRRKLWSMRGAWRYVGIAMLMFIPLGVALGVAVAIFAPERLFSLVRNRTDLWLAIMIFYPIFSVYPQELIYRTFLFHRYRHLFTRPWAIITASALSFAYMHILFDHWLSVALTVAGGFLFAWTYHRSQSTFAAWVEHAIWGCFIFTIGLGWFFFAGRAAMPV